MALGHFTINFALALKTNLRQAITRFEGWVKILGGGAGQDAEENGWEEYFDYIFPDEEKKAPSLKILEMAHKWKKQKTGDEDE